MHYQPATRNQLEVIFDKGMQCIPLSEIEVAQYRTEILCELAKEYAQHRWTMQIHIGAMRSVNSRMLANLGRDCGYDSSSDRACLAPLAQLLNRLDHVGALPDTLLFSLDPTLDAALATLAGNFPGNGEVTKVQLGPAWWQSAFTAS
ncbi:glucuronate isomerase [Yersinia intermedia]|nr:glucuronate isomerase [Yersinia intermedia]MCW8113801.1 glucuronate isomerase [Yersinia intermedia]MDA5518646.1 glucuronate isomerase [Yersinia intermedia]